MMIENPLKNMKINNYYSYLLVLGGFLLIISFLYEPIIISQQKLILLCIVTILFGIVIWMREDQFNERAKQVNLEWMAFWDNQPMKGIEQINDQNYDSNLRKKFLKESGSENMMQKYHRNTWVIFVIYILIMISIYLR